MRDIIEPAFWAAVGVAIVIVVAIILAFTLDFWWVK